MERAVHGESKSFREKRSRTSLLFDGRQFASAQIGDARLHLVGQGRRPRFNHVFCPTVGLDQLTRSNLPYQVEGQTLSMK